MWRVAVLLLSVCSVFNSCAVEVASPAYIVRGNAPGVLGFMPVSNGWLLLRCNTLADWHAYHQASADDSKADIACHPSLPRHFTTEELAATQQRLAASQQQSKLQRAAHITLSLVLAAASVPISRALVADLKKVIPITLVVGLALHHVQQEIGHIIMLSKEKNTARAELHNPSVLHRSTTALTSIEEVLIQQLQQTPTTAP